LEPEQRVVLHIFNVQNISDMKQTKEEKREMKMAQLRAAHMLMTEFVKENADDIASIIGELTPFLLCETDLSGIRNYMNVVNATFATVALEVIKGNNVEEPEHETLSLPVDANRMQNSIFTLNRMLDRLSHLFYFIEIHEKVPAFKMCQEAYDKDEILS
jgi:hypothetical protein